MQHTCHAKGCAVSVPPKMFMCKRHWFMLPHEQRNAVWASYRPGQEITKTPSDAYLTAARSAIAWLAAHEQQTASG